MRVIWIFFLPILTDLSAKKKQKKTRNLYQINNCKKQLEKFPSPVCNPKFSKAMSTKIRRSTN